MIFLHTETPKSMSPLFLKFLLALTMVLAVGLPLRGEESVVFEDGFERGLGDGWRWIRENATDWRVRDEALEIRVVPGKANTVKNALVRPAPDRSQGTFAIEVTVTNISEPIQQFEQAGITWYHEGKPVRKLVKELVSGQLKIIPGGKPMEDKTVQLRLIVTADSFTAQYRGNAEGDFQTAATGKLPPPGKDEVSIQCYDGPAEAEHWMRFDDFRIIRLSDAPDKTNAKSE